MSDKKASQPQPKVEKPKAVNQAAKVKVQVSLNSDYAQHPKFAKFKQNKEVQK